MGLSSCESGEPLEVREQRRVGFQSSPSDAAGDRAMSIPPAKFHSLGQGSVGGSPKIKVEFWGQSESSRARERREGLALPETGGDAAGDPGTLLRL